ncbi:hypothetical protein QQP08_002759 [Theobroma cacao]|nr:hypothetical protein QQP08_002759 [Theobroma cacao]
MRTDLYYSGTLWNGIALLMLAIPLHMQVNKIANALWSLYIRHLKEEVKERARRAAAAARRWREYSRRGVDEPSTFKLPKAVSNKEKRRLQRDNYGSIKHAMVPFFLSNGHELSPRGPRIATEN